MTNTTDEFYPDAALPFHYRDNGQPCPWSGKEAPSGCPNGCDHADHYSNDGHRGCVEVPAITGRTGLGKSAVTVGEMHTGNTAAARKYVDDLIRQARADGR